MMQLQQVRWNWKVAHVLTSDNKFFVACAKSLRWKNHNAITGILFFVTELSLDTFLCLTVITSPVWDYMDFSAACLK